MVVLFEVIIHLFDWLLEMAVQDLNHRFETHISVESLFQSTFLF